MGASTTSPVRSPLGGEDRFFKANPHVGGMADFSTGTVVLNPYSKLSPEEQQAVVQNERTRLFLHSVQLPAFGMTSEQQQNLGGYSPNQQDVRDTIIGRIVSGDPSAGRPTPEQERLARYARRGAR